MTRTISLAILTVLLTATAACSDIEVDRVRIEEVRSPSADTHVDARSIRLPVGVAVEVRAEIIFKGDSYYYGDYYHLEPADDYILGVAPIEGSDKYLIWGASTGHTCLKVNVAGTVETCIDTVVTEPTENTGLWAGAASSR